MNCDDDGGVSLEARCVHYPEYVYQWPEEMRSIVGEYHAHCAKCGTDYQLTDYKILREARKGGVER